MDYKTISTDDDPRCTDPRWRWQEWEDWFGEDGWQESFRPGNFTVRAGSEENSYSSQDAIGAVIQAMERYPHEDDFEIEGWGEE